MLIDPGGDVQDFVISMDIRVDEICQNICTISSRIDN